MSLADRGWADSKTYTGLISPSLAQRWKKRGSSFLLVAILLCVLGVLIGPLQQGFLRPRTIKSPRQLKDFSNLHEVFNDRLGSLGFDYVVAKTRAALSAATVCQPQNQLWSGAGFKCDPPTLPHGQEDIVTFLKACDQGTTFRNFSRLPDPFYAELPGGFHTGLVRQYLPRFNSTANFAPISTSEFPLNCQTINGSFFTKYLNDTVVHEEAPTGRQIWGVQACMPGAMLQKPWKYTRERQDFSEDLFLNISLSVFDNEGIDIGKPTNTLE